MCAFSGTHTSAFMYINSHFHIRRILPAELYSIRYYADGKRQFTHLPMASLGKDGTPEASAGLLWGAWHLQGQPESLLHPSVLALLSVFLSFYHFSFFSPPILFLWLSSSKNVMKKKFSYDSTIYIIWWSQCQLSDKDNSFSPTINLNTTLAFF